MVKLVLQVKQEKDTQRSHYENTERHAILDGNATICHAGFDNALCSLMSGVG